MPTWRASVKTAVVMAVAASLPALSGCAAHVGSSTSQGEARTQLVGILDATQAAVGGEWEVRDDPTPRGCVLSTAGAGQRYPALRLGPAPANPRAAVAAVTRAWTAWGLEVDTLTVGDVIQLQGSSRMDALVTFRVSDAAMTLLGESECLPAA